MSMTPEEASAFICPVLPRLRKKLEGFGDCMTEAQQKCIGPACMWWIRDPLHEPDGECAVTATVGWLDAINQEQ